MVCPHFVCTQIRLLPFAHSAKAEVFLVLTVVPVGISPLMYCDDGLALIMFVLRWCLGCLPGFLQESDRKKMMII